MSASVSSRRVPVRSRLVACGTRLLVLIRLKEPVNLSIMPCLTAGSWFSLSSLEQVMWLSSLSILRVFMSKVFTSVSPTISQWPDRVTWVVIFPRKQ